MVPENIYLLTPETCKYVTFCGKEDPTNLEMERSSLILQVSLNVITRILL